MDVFRALPAIREELDDIDQRLRGRMARIVSSDGHMVTVEVPTAGPDGSLLWDGPLGPYPATVADVPAGSTGELLPLRGNQALFVATGVGTVVPFGDRRTGIQTATAIATYVDYITIPLALSAGTYRIAVSASATLGKSVDSGNLYINAGVDASVNNAHMNSTVLSINQRTALYTRHDVTVTLATAGTVTARLGFTHTGAAGTVTMYHGVLDGWYQRIG